jgi:hypothetical protein
VRRFGAELVQTPEIWDNLIKEVKPEELNKFREDFIEQDKVLDAMEDFHLALFEKAVASNDALKSFVEAKIKSKSPIWRM